MADLTLDGNTYRIERGEEGEIGYELSYLRRSVSVQGVQLLGVSGEARPERTEFHQTSWAGGSAWWKPITDAGNLDMYFDIDNLDAFNKPGTIMPSNTSAHVAPGIQNIAPMFTVGTDVYTISTTSDVDATYFDVAKWTPASDTWVDEAGYSCGLNDATIHAIAYNDDDGYVYGMSNTHVARFIIGGAQNSNWQALSPAATHADTLFITELGKPFVYHDGIIKELDTTGPSLTTIVDDGYGKDMLASIADPTNDWLRESQVTLAVAASNGIFYAKNTLVNGQPQAFLARVDRDQAGTYIRYPLGTLPPGVMVLNIAVHLGSVILTCTPDWQLVMGNDQDASDVPRVDLYHYTDGGGLGALGSPDRETPTQFPARILGAIGWHLLLGSEEQVWVYDARNGGLHPWLNFQATTTGIATSMALGLDSSGDQVLLIKSDSSTNVFKTQQANPDTVVAFGDDTTHYVLESNYFDFQRPFEDKTLMSVEVLTESTTASQQWEVFISIDDGAWSSIATHSNATFSTTDLSAGSHTGKRFRYKLVYQTKDATLAGFRGVRFTAAHGTMVPVWRLRLNASEVRNEENKVLDPDTVMDNLKTLAVKETPVTFIDSYEAHQLSESTTYTVTVQDASIRKADRNEGVISVTLVGQ